MGRSIRGLTITIGPYRHLCIGDAADLVGVTPTTISSWFEAGAIAGARKRIGNNEHTFVAEDDVVTIANMTTAEVHDLGLFLQPERRREISRRWQRKAQDSTILSARNEHLSWTAEQLAVLRRDIPLTEMAKLVGRTYVAVSIERHRMEMSSDKGHCQVVPEAVPA